MGVKRHGDKWQVDLESAYVGVYQDEQTARMAFQHGRYMRALGKPLGAVIRELRGRPEAPSLQQVYEEWYDTLVVSDETRYRYRLNYTRFATPLASKPVSDINAADIRRMVSGMSTRGYSPKTIHVSAATLKAVLAFALDSEYIERVPAFKLPEMVRKREPSTVTPDEYRAMVEAAPDRWKPLVALLPLCGLRIGEMLGLTWDNVNLTEGWLRVAHQVRPCTQSRAKTKTPRSGAFVPLLPEAVEWLRIQQDRGYPSDEGWVFATGTGHVPGRTTVRRMFAAIEKTTGRNIRPHDLRHTAGSWLLDSGASLAVVSAFLRHSSVTTTSTHYTHMISGADRAAMIGLAEYLNGDGAGTVTSKQVE